MMLVGEVCRDQRCVHLTFIVHRFGGERLHVLVHITERAVTRQLDAVLQFLVIAFLLMREKLNGFEAFSLHAPAPTRTNLQFHYHMTSDRVAGCIFVSYDASS